MAPILFPGSWVANAPGDLKDGNGYGSKLVYGGCWKIAGRLNRMTDLVST